MPRRGENIFKRKDGRWEARYVKEIKLDGTKIYGSVYARTYNEVKQKQRLCIFIPKTNIKNVPITVEQLAMQWLVTIKNQVKITTYEKYKGVVKNHIVPNIGKINASLLTTTLIAEFTENLLEILSPATVNNTLIILGEILKFGSEEYNFTISKIKYTKTNSKEMRVLSKEEQQTLTAYLLTDINNYKIAILFALYTGVRIGELCALQYSDIQNGTVKINKTMQRIKDGNKTEIKILPPKSKSSNRLIPLPNILLNLIDESKDTGYFITQPNGKFIEPRLLQLKFKKYTKACNIENANFHCLRHTFATRCIEADWDIKSLSEVLGHADVKTTLNKYVHSSFEQKQLNMEKLELALAI